MSLTLLGAGEVRRGVRALAAQVAGDARLPAGELPIVCVDTAACRLSADLARLLREEFARPSRITHVRPADPLPSHLLRGTHLVLDTLFDTGRTFRRLERIEGPRATLCVKDEVAPRYAPLPDWWVFLVPNVYIYGYGLDDAAGLNRDLDAIRTDEPLPSAARVRSRAQAEARR